MVKCRIMTEKRLVTFALVWTASMIAAAYFYRVLVIDTQYDHTMKRPYAASAQAAILESVHIK